MLTQHIALVPDVDGQKFDAAELARVSAALQTQVIRDLAPIWGVTATVAAFPYLEEVPLGYWPIIISSADLRSQAGVHIDKTGQPFALVQVSPQWSLYASRACLEMLINPLEHRTVVAAAPRPDRGPAEVLVEIAGPCAVEHSYIVDEVIVSDFCTPAFFGMRTRRADGCSFSGAIAGPLQVQRGGHMAWYDPIANNWWLRSHWGVHPLDTRLGTLDRRSVSIREFVQACASLRSRPESSPVHEEVARMRAMHAQAAQLRATRLRALPEAQLESELKLALDGLHRRQDMHDRVEEAFVAEPTMASRAHERWRRDEEEIDVGLELLDDDDTSEATEPSQPAPSMRMPRTTIRPPFPAASPSTTERASERPPAVVAAVAGTSRSSTPPPNTTRTTSFPPVVWTVPPSASATGNKRGPMRDAIVVGGAIAAAAVVALALNSGSGSIAHSNADRIATSRPQTTSSIERVAAPVAVAPAPSAEAPATALAASAMAAAAPAAPARAEAPSPAAKPTPVAPAAEHPASRSTSNASTTATTATAATASSRSSQAQRALDRLPSPTPATRSTPERPATSAASVAHTESLEELIDTRR